MKQTISQQPLATRLIANISRFAISLIIPGLTLVMLYYGFKFLKDSEASKGVTVIVALILGVGGVALLYAVFNKFVEDLPEPWGQLLQPFVFVGPAMVILAFYLAVPTAITLYDSFRDNNGETFIFLDNYITIFSQRDLRVTFRNNLMWIVFGTSFSVGFGLIIAVLADRSSYERTAKSLIFLPMAISFVGAGVIWNFMYEADPRIGLLNAIWVNLFGGDPQAWTALIQPWNNLFLIAIVVWLQTGFAMVLFSAALKGIPNEVMEAARVDGANELQIFFQVMIPHIMSTIITVTTTIVIFTLKIFDIVLVMTGGQFGTEVIATQYYRQNFTNRNAGLGSALAIILLLAVIPVMVYNLKQFSEREAF